MDPKLCRWPSRSKIRQSGMPDYDHIWNAKTAKDDASSATAAASRHYWVLKMDNWESIPQTNSLYHLSAYSGQLVHPPLFHITHFRSTWHDWSHRGTITLWREMEYRCLITTTHRPVIILSNSIRIHRANNILLCDSSYRNVSQKKQ